jgi:phospholipid transport system transporter-binding protein
MSHAEVERAGDRIRLTGVLDFATVGRLREQGLALFEASPGILLDLAGVERANSAGLALLLEWLDLAQQRGQRLRLCNLPDSLQAIARISNLDGRLPAA